jgi:hypothetical protein
MPETSMNKHCDRVAGQHNIGLSRQVLALNSEPISEPMQKPPNSHFGRSIPGSHSTHILAAALLRNPVHKRLNLGG